MDIITRFVNAGWAVNINQISCGVMIRATKGEEDLIAEGRNFKEAKQDLCFMNSVELSIFDRV